MSIVMDVRLFFTIAINVRWLHIVITKGDMAPPIRRKNRAPHILIIVVVISLFLSSSSSWYPRRCILVIVLSCGVSSLSVVLFVVVVLYPHCRHISIVHLEDLVRGIAPRGIVHLNAHIRLHMGRVIQVASVCKWESAGYFPWVKIHLQTGGSHLQTGGVCKRGVTC